MSRISKLVAVITTFVIAVALACSGESFAQGIWTEKTPMPTPRAAAMAAVVNGLLYLFGGSNCAMAPPNNNCHLPNRRGL